jgi:signal transduction histidine kinase
VELVPLPVDHGDPEVAMVVARDITERRRLESERATLASQIIAALEAERRQLAEDLHDDAVQALAAAQMRLSAAAAKTSDHRAVHDLQAVQETLEYAMRACRTFLFNLRPPLLDLHGLPPALHQQLDRVAEQAGCAVELDWTVTQRLAEDTEMVLFRTIQEALTNISKHAKPCKVVVRGRAKEHVVVVEIVDDGVGFDPDQVAREKPLLGHLGLPAMGERVRLAGGSLTIVSQPGQGTTVSIVVPLSPDPALA